MIFCMVRIFIKQTLLSTNWILNPTVISIKQRIGIGIIQVVTSKSAEKIKLLRVCMIVFVLVEAKFLDL